MKTNWFALLSIVITIIGGLLFLGKSEQQYKPVPSLIRVGVLPDVSIETLHQRYKPLLNYLSDKTGLQFKLLVPSSYDELTRLFINSKVDLAHFGGLTYLRTYKNQHAEPLVMREVDTRFTSLFIAKPTSGARKLTDFKDKSFSFGSQLSTSGHLMPRHFMQSNKIIIPENFFSEVRYSGAHDKTAYMVRDNKVDLGAANSEVIRTMFKDGRLEENDIQIIYETPPYPDYIWITQKTLNPQLKMKIRNAFLALNIYDKTHNHILKALGAKNFLPADHNKYHPLQQIAEELKLLESEK